MFRIDLYFLRKTFTAASAAAFFSLNALADTAETWFRQLQDQPLAGSRITLRLDIAAPGSANGLSVSQEGDRVTMRYPMMFNQIAEGWSWRPGADPELEDYYRYKFLPVQSVIEARGEYSAEDKIGEVQTMKVLWRYDYFLAFDNLYDFYPRKDDDDAGFSASLPAELAAHTGVKATLRLSMPLTQESTTFWKATHANPVDFTLKKRYLTGDLESVTFFDLANGKTLCDIPRGRAHCSVP